MSRGTIALSHHDKLKGQHEVSASFLLKNDRDVPHATKLVEPEVRGGAGTGTISMQPHRTANGEVGTIRGNDSKDLVLWHGFECVDCEALLLAWAVRAHEVHFKAKGPVLSIDHVEPHATNAGHVNRGGVHGLPENGAA